MQRLFKCQFYFMSLLTAVLFIVGTAISDDHTDISTDSVEQKTQKPTIIILGSRHFANPGMDGTNTKMDDVLAPKRQREIEQLVTQLKAFQPTKIAIEADPARDTRVNASYQDYLAGTYELRRNESDQIGFRLAKQMGHPKLYCVDFWDDWGKAFSLDRDKMDFDTFAKTNNLEHLLPSPPTEGKITQDEDGTIWIEPEKYVSIIDTYVQDNQPEGIRKEHQLYLRIARIGLGREYPGANWVWYWYERNLKIFVNLTRITESADDRILFIVGAGHVFLVQQFLEDSGDYTIESPLKYLKGNTAEKPASEKTD